MMRWILLGSFFVLATQMARADDFRPLLEKREFAGAGDGKLLYRLMKPENYDSKEKYPLVVFLHGMGERGDDNDAQLKHGVAEFAKPENRKKYPCFLMAPQCPVTTTWSNFGMEFKKEPTPAMRLLLEAVPALVKEFSIDDKRIYVTGLSMGGFGTWDAIVRMPDLFAAAVPICGGGDVKTAETIAKLPIWVFHGAKDTVVKPERSRSMVEALKKAGGDPKYTEYPNESHASWVPAYKDAEMFAWLFAQKKK
ncbi:MAG TPA: prolyl oligopeptidase family serine peptidase [Gemmataceae bacterium]|jgi:predicted peptidase|nr:prolyl oligopeptidase family serine peptidase [Gemmataceae bacterium]